MTADLAPYDVGYGATSVLCLAIAAYRARYLVRYRSGYLAATVCLAFVFTGAAFGFAAPAVYLAVDDVTGVPNGATLAVYVCILLTSGSFLALLAAWTGQPRRRVVAWAAAYLVVIAAMVVLFVHGSADDGEHPIDFDAHYAADPVLGRFLLLYYAGFAVAMGGTAWMSRRYSRVAGAGRPWLARGLRLTAWGALLAVGYCLLKVIAVVGIMRGAPTEPLSTVWAPLSATVGALFMAAGLSLPAWAPVASETLGRILAYRRLHPLWRLLTEAVPSVVLEPRPASWRTALTERWALRDVTHRLYRRAVEIHDARLALGPWLDPAAELAPDGAAGHGPDGAAGPGADGAAELGADGAADGAAREAALLAAAVRAKAAGKPARHGRHLPRDPGAEWADQLGWLLAVARELPRPPAS